MESRSGRAKIYSPVSHSGLESGLPGGRLTSGWPPAGTALDWCVLPPSPTHCELFWGISSAFPVFSLKENSPVYKSGREGCWACAEDAVIGRWGRSLCELAASLSAVAERLKGSRNTRGPCCWGDRAWLAVYSVLNLASKFSLIKSLIKWNIEMLL